MLGLFFRTDTKKERFTSFRFENALCCPLKDIASAGVESKDPKHVDYDKVHILPVSLFVKS